MSPKTEMRNPASSHCFPWVAVFHPPNAPKQKVPLFLLALLLFHLKILSVLKHLKFVLPVQAQCREKSRSLHCSLGITEITFFKELQMFILGSFPRPG